jgi:hypothetical protein
VELNALAPDRLVPVRVQPTVAPLRPCEPARYPPPHGIGAGQRRRKRQEMPSSRIMGSSPFRQLLTTRDTPMRKPATGEPVRETARTFRRAGRVNTLPDPINGGQPRFHPGRVGRRPV